MTKSSNSATTEITRALKTIASFSLDGEEVDGTVYKMNINDAFNSITDAVTIAREALAVMRETS